MAAEVPTLYEECLKEAAGLLKKPYWSPELPLQQNPFCYLPSVFIDKLIEYVARASNVEPLLSSDLQLLIRSGRVREFILECDNVNVDRENFEKILMELSSSCRLLHKVKINVDRHWDCLSYNPSIDRAISCLLREAKNLRNFESNAVFNITALQYSSRLVTLDIEFPFYTNHIYDFLEVNGQLKINTSLKELHLYTDLCYLDTAVILKYCTELIFIDSEISKSLEYLHDHELQSGTLTQKYKIQICQLGSESNSDDCASRDAVLIATLTCPFLREVTMYVNDVEAICALSYTRSLDTLRLHWSPCHGLGDFNTVRSLLEKEEFGSRLKCIELKWFTHIDFNAIGICCPNIEELEVSLADNTRSEFLPNIFRKLRTLLVEDPF